MIKFRPSAKFDKPAAVIFLTQEQIKKNNFPQITRPQMKQALAELGHNNQFHGEKKEVFPLVLGKQLYLFVGAGEEKKLTLTSLRVVVRQALLSSYLKKIQEIELISFEQKDATIKAIIEGVGIGSYSWKKYRTPVAEDKDSPEKTFFLVAPDKPVYQEAVNICEGITLARDLVNDNADIVTADYLEKVVRDIIKGAKNVSLEILNKKELAAKGLNLHLAVNQASRKEPKLIIVKYTGASQKGNYTALIGKGLTFDTGGLNLKPSGHIETMRCDMSGAAAVIGILKNALALKLKKNIIFVLGIAENAIGSGAYKPGDVFKSYSGKTVEIGNTDAEGRLVLADSLAYVAKNYKPGRVIDIATLTGACVVALGFDYSGLISDNDTLAQQLLDAANATDDRAWRLPNYPELKDAIKSQIADLKNVGLPRGAAGTMTAAEFLHQFTNDIPWAHLDIAGTAFMEEPSRSYYSWGATGAGVRLLTEYLKKN